MQTSAKPIRRAWAPALIWLAVIAWESTPLGGSRFTAILLAPFVRTFVPQFTPAQLDLVNAAARKIGHFFGYAMLSLLMLRAWWATLALPRSATQAAPWRDMVRSWSAPAAAIAWLSSVAVASLDEWHQTFLPGRTGTIRDVALDAMAAGFVQLLLIAASNVRPMRALIKHAERTPDPATDSG